MVCSIRSLRLILGITGQLLYGPLDQRTMLRHRPKNRRDRPKILWVLHSGLLVPGAPVLKRKRHPTHSVGWMSMW